MWSWAVTSSRDLGRLWLLLVRILMYSGLVRGRSHYFSTHGWSLFFSGCAGVLEELALAAASF